MWRSYNRAKVFLLDRKCFQLYVFKLIFVNLIYFVVVSWKFKVIFFFFLIEKALLITDPPLTSSTSLLRKRERKKLHLTPDT